MNVIRYNYETKTFSNIELRLFNKGSKKNNQKKQVNIKEWDSLNQADRDLAKKKQSEFGNDKDKYIKWIKSKGWTPEVSGGGGGNGGNDNGGDNYSKTSTSGNTKNEGSGNYTSNHKFQEDFKIGKMNARKYTTVRLLKERLNELLEDGTIDDVAEDGNYNYVIRIKKTTGTGSKSTGKNYIYVGVYVIDDNTYGLVRWDLKKGGNYVDGIKNATIAGPDNLRQVIKKIKSSEQTIWESLDDKLRHPGRTILGEFGGWLLKVAANSIGFVADQLKKWGESR